jgi:hypothetical protein
MKTYFMRILWIVTAVAALIVSTNALAASDYLLEIEGIKGECKGKKFKMTENSDGSFTVTNIPAGTYKLIAVPAQGVDPSIPHLSMKFECVVSPRDAASGQATGKRQHKPFTITKELDKMSPKGTSLGEIVVGDLDGDGSADRSLPLRQQDNALEGNTSSKSTTSERPVGYDLKINKKV